MDKPPREAQTKVDRESVKVLAIAVGVREAARQLGIPESTLQARSARGKWFANTTQTNVGRPCNHIATKPSDALRSTLAEDSRKTKLGFSKAARKVAESQAELGPEALRKPAEALSASKWHQVAESIHQWNTEAKGSGIMPGLQIYSEQTVVSVQPVSEQKPVSD